MISNILDLTLIVEIFIEHSAIGQMFTSILLLDIDQSLLNLFCVVCLHGEQRLWQCFAKCHSRHYSHSVTHSGILVLLPRRRFNPFAAIGNYCRHIFAYMHQRHGDDKIIMYSSRTSFSFFEASKYLQY